MLQKAIPWLVLLCLIGVYALAQPISPFGYIDDAYISFRYAANLADGHGLVYNIGERVEGYSNTLFVLLMALLAKLGFAIPTAATALGVFFQAAVVALLLATMRRFLSEPLLRPLPIFGLLFVVMHPSGVAYAEAGMETNMAAFWLLLAVYWVAVAVERGRGWLTSIGAGLATLALALTRPEGIAMVAPLGLWIFAGKKEGRWPRSIAYALMVLIPYGLFLAWRISYFGDWQPNTYYAKAHGAGLSLIIIGLDYLWRFTNISLLPYLCLPVLILLARFRVRLPVWWYGVGGTVLVYLAAIVYVGGDHFPLARFLIPVIPLLVLLLAEAGRHLRDAINAAYPNIAQLELQPASWVAVALLLPLTVVFGLLFRNEGLIFIGQVKKAEIWCRIGKHLKETYPENTSIGLIPIGAIGYCSELPVVDIVGLTDAHIARVRTDLSRSMAGHGRYDSQYVLTQKKPKIIMALIELVPFPVPEWFMRKGVGHLAIRDLIERRQFIDEYAFHRAKIGPMYLHYWSRRDFEGPEVNPGNYPVEGVNSPIPEREPLAGETLGEKIWGKQDTPEEPFEVPEDWEVW